MQNQMVRAQYGSPEHRRRRRYNVMGSSIDRPSTHAESEPLIGSEPPLGRSHLRILRLKEVMATVGLGRAAIYQMKREGKFPKPVKIGVRAVGWIAEDVVSWIARRANREVMTALEVSEEHSKPVKDTKSEAPPVERQVHRNSEGGMSPHDYQELVRLRAIEQRLRQVTQLQSEIAALLVTPSSENEVSATNAQPRRK